MGRETCIVLKVKFSVHAYMIIYNLLKLNAKHIVTEISDG